MSKNRRLFSPTASRANREYVQATPVPIPSVLGRSYYLAYFFNILDGRVLAFCFYAVHGVLVWEYGGVGVWA